MIENYTRLSSRMFTATVVGKDKNGRKITEGRETYKTPSGVYEIKDWARLVEKAAEADGLLPLLEQIKRHVKEYAWMKNASDINVLILAAELVACHLITEEYLSTLPDTEKALGDYSLGRYAWELRNIKELPEPIKAKGQQGLWSWEA